ncbi:MAG TPA: energy-coupling factor transporter transmembrane component T [Candidatus Limnocylindrales bacterium]|nr:energy-coupling factor transporter transmembrane component T [Candidatus Limnocylindrales bacterium]
MIGPIELDERSRSTPLGRASPLAKLAVAVVWLGGLALTVDPRPPALLAALALASGLLLGRIPVGTLVGRLAPLGLAALVVGISNALVSPANADPAQFEVGRLGSLRLTLPAAQAGLSLGLRVVAIASLGTVFALTTDATRLTDALVQVARLPERFAYGALAAYQAVPGLSRDLTTLQQARRIRGLRQSWHPEVLLALLVLAVRHADRQAVAMDARAFGLGPRTRYRVERWRRQDTVLILISVLVLAAALATSRL